MNAPFPYPGGKRAVVPVVWERLGSPKQYIEPFCGSAAMLLGAPKPARLEVVNDVNGFIANFWRAVKHAPGAVAEWADYPVSHIDQTGRHRWLMEQRTRLGGELQDPDWPGDAKAAGWWLWGQCSWIGTGWCVWTGQIPRVSDAGLGVQAPGQIPRVSDAGLGVQAPGQIPRVSDAGLGVQAPGKIPRVSDAGLGVQAPGQIPHVGTAGLGVQAPGQIPHVGTAGMGVHLWTSSGAVAWGWLHKLAARLERVRILCGNWDRCLNSHYGGTNTAVFLDPPYITYEGVYKSERIAGQVAEWARGHADLRIAICGLAGDYDLPGWEEVSWRRPNSFAWTTADQERIWFSPACLPVGRGQLPLMGESE